MRAASADRAAAAGCAPPGRPPAGPSAAARLPFTRTSPLRMMRWMWLNDRPGKRASRKRSTRMPASSAVTATVCTPVGIAPAPARDGGRCGASAEARMLAVVPRLHAAAAACEGRCGRVPGPSPFGGSLGARTSGDAEMATRPMPMPRPGDLLAAAGLPRSVTRLSPAAPLLAQLRPILQPLPDLALEAALGRVVELLPAELLRGNSPGRKTRPARRGRIRSPRRSPRSSSAWSAR